MKKTLIILLSTLILFAGCNSDFFGGNNEGSGNFSPPNVTELSLNTWADGNITASNGEQWFKFVDSYFYPYKEPTIHINFGTLTNLNVQIYNSNGSTIGGKKNYSGNTKINKWENNLPAVQYIKVTPNSGSGTYMIACNTSDTAPDLPITLPSNAIALTADDAWTDGNIQTGTDEQWFKFTATGIVNSMTNTRFIHINFDTLTNLDIQIYDNRGYVVKSENLSGEKETVKFTSCNFLTGGQDYYIKVSTNSDGGAYKIMLSLSHEEPVTYIILPSDVPALTADVWTDGDIPTETDVQWFKFTATSETHYIHFKQNTLSGIYVQIYNTDGSRASIKTGLNNNTPLNNLTVGQEYYLRILPYSYKIYFYNSLNYYYSSSCGTYQIMLNKSSVAPLVLPSDANTLTKDIWTDGNFTTRYGEQWYTFTATDSTQYIHFNLDTIKELYFQMYDSIGYAVDADGNLINISKKKAHRYACYSLTAGHEYYIKVSTSDNLGTYQITFNASTESPAIELPSNAGMLTAGWNTVPTSSDESWFKFTADAATQFIHIAFSSSLDVYVQMYDSDGYQSGSCVTFSPGVVKDSDWNLTIGQEYYIKAWTNSTNNNYSYQIALNDSLIAPAIPVPPVPPVVRKSLNSSWTGSSFTETTHDEWFEFTATSNRQFIHANFGTLDPLYGFVIHVFDIANDVIIEYFNFTVISRWVVKNEFVAGRKYLVHAQSLTHTGTYYLAVNTSTTAPK
ncbi:hypothetical protein R84B8_01397 [Treponema sp. R8-4-B8]